jgi:hypothetical protein
MATRNTERASSSGLTVVLPIDLSVSQASSKAASKSTSVWGSKELATHCSTLDFIRTICVINGSFGANLAKFVATVHDGTAGRFGSTAFDRASRVSALHSRVESTSEAERRERFGLLAGNISLMPNGTLDSFNRVLDFDEGLTHVFRVTAIVFLRQTLRDVAAVRNLSISCCDQLLNVLVILSRGGLLSAILRAPL